MEELTKLPTVRQLWPVARSAESSGHISGVQGLFGIRLNQEEE